MFVHVVYSVLSGHYGRSICRLNSFPNKTTNYKLQTTIDVLLHMFNFYMSMHGHPRSYKLNSHVHNSMVIMVVLLSFVSLYPTCLGIIRLFNFLFSLLSLASSHVQQQNGIAFHKYRMMKYRKLCQGVAR